MMRNRSRQKLLEGAAHIRIARLSRGTKYLLKIFAKTYHQNPSIADAVHSEPSIDIFLAKVMVSLWSHAAFADGRFYQSENHIISLLVGALFDEGALLEGRENEDELFQMLTETFAKHPIPLEMVGEVGQLHRRIAMLFFDHSCLITAGDGVYQEEELSYLQKLRDSMNLSNKDYEIIYNRYKLFG